MATFIRSIRRSVGVAVAGAVGFMAGPLWMALARREAQHGTVVDLGPHVERFGLYFDEALLAGVEVRAVDRVRLPGSWLVRRAAVNPAGLCLGRVVVLAAELIGSERFESVLFHELVHAVQMRRMGTARFCGSYLAGWRAAGRSYFGIPLEREAFELQGRFQDAEIFRVHDAVDGSRA